MKKNDIIELEITAMSSEGVGIGRYEGLAVFVPLTAIGDRIFAQILKILKNRVYAKINKVIISSKDRIEQDCSVFAKCGGCVYRHISYETEKNYKKQRVEDAIRRIGGVDLNSMPIESGESFDRYRNKAQYPISSEYEVGFFAGHSHRIIPSNDCKLQPEEFYQISNIFTEWLKENKISIYNEETGKGLVRHLYIRKAILTDEIMVCIVINGDSLDNSQSLVERLISALQNKIKTVVLNINKKQTNVIMGEECRSIYGDGYIYDILSGVKVRLNPLSFYQVNHDMAERLYKKAQEYAKPENKIVLDLYCGAGTIGLSMAKKAKQIIGVEIIPEAINDAKFNAKNNNIDNARFICADASKAAESLKNEGIKPDIVLVDPPRKGCSEALLHTIAEDFKPERVVYVSCDPSTLARDVSILSQLGYRLVEYTPFDLFPRTHHVETVCLLTSVKNQPHIDFDLDIDDFHKKPRNTATYTEIKEYVQEHYGFKVSSKYIGQVKEKCGLEKRENYNKGNGKSKELICPPEKEEAIIKAFEYFGMK